jgi:hypothetical protein
VGEAVGSALLLAGSFALANLEIEEPATDKRDIDESIPDKSASINATAPIRLHMGEVIDRDCDGGCRIQDKKCDEGEHGLDQARFELGLIGHY